MSIRAKETRFPTFWSGPTRNGRRSKLFSDVPVALWGHSQRSRTHLSCQEERNGFLPVLDPMGAAGTVIDPPAQFRTYVTTNSLDPVYLEGEVVVGAGVQDRSSCEISQTMSIVRLHQWAACPG